MPKACLIGVHVTEIELDLIKNHGWEIEIDRSSPSEWAKSLDLFEDANLYQTASYGAVRWGEKNLSRLILKQHGEVRAMAQFRIIRPTPLKFGMAYLRWGPVWERKGAPPDPDVLARMAGAIEHEYLKKRKLFLRIIPNAFEGSPRATAMRSAFSQFTAEAPNSHNLYRTFVLDLGPSIEELRSGLDKKWRNQLTRAEKNDLKVTSGTGTDLYRAFCRIYKEMRERKRFDTTVDVEEFEQIQGNLPESNRMQVLICEDAAGPVAGLVASMMGDSAIYLLGATSDRGLNSKGAYLLQWSLISRLKQSGIKSYDLGGIDPEGNPGVYHFKRGFSGVDVCQIPPLVASNSAMSSGLAKASLAMQRSLRGSLDPRTIVRSFKTLAAKS